MADLARADELVRTIERDAAFRAEVEAAPTISAKRQVLDERGFQDVGLEDIKAYVESQGGTLVVVPGGRELSEQELAAVAGGYSAEMVDTGMDIPPEVLAVGVAAGVGIGLAAVAGA